VDGTDEEKVSLGDVYIGLVKMPDVFKFFRKDSVYNLKKEGFEFF